MPRRSGRVWLLLTHRAPRRKPRAASRCGEGGSRRAGAHPFRRRRGRRGMRDKPGAPQARDGGNMNEHQALRISGSDPAPVAPFTKGRRPATRRCPPRQAEGVPIRRLRQGAARRERRAGASSWSTSSSRRARSRSATARSSARPRATRASRAKASRAEHVARQRPVRRLLHRGSRLRRGHVRRRRARPPHQRDARRRRPPRAAARDLRRARSGRLHGRHRALGRAAPRAEAAARLDRAGARAGARRRLRLHRGRAGVGKRSLARLAASLREGGGEVLVVDGAAPRAPPRRARRAPSSRRAPGPRRGSSSTPITSRARCSSRSRTPSAAAAAPRSSPPTSQPLDRATGDGHIAPWFATLFSGKRVTVPSLDARREDILPIVRDIAERRAIPLERLPPEFLEALVRVRLAGRRPPARGRPSPRPSSRRPRGRSRSGPSPRRWRGRCGSSPRSRRRPTPASRAPASRTRWPARTAPSPRRPARSACRGRPSTARRIGSASTSRGARPRGADERLRSPPASTSSDKRIQRSAERRTELPGGGRSGGAWALGVSRRFLFPQTSPPRPPSPSKSVLPVRSSTARERGEKSASPPSPGPAP